MPSLFMCVRRVVRQSHSQTAGARRVPFCLTDLTLTVIHLLALAGNAMNVDCGVCQPGLDSCLHRPKDIVPSLHQPLHIHGRFGL